jgi:hypothetical protein
MAGLSGEESGEESGDGRVVAEDALRGRPSKINVLRALLDWFESNRAYQTPVP